ncbi:hypothetical protein ACFL6I_26175, partial [candidate division KSB1 bacterium]
LIVTGEGDLTLYENGAQIDTGTTPLETIKQYNNIGLYNITLKHNTTENYTSSIETHWLNVVDYIQPTPSNPTETPADPATYVTGQDYQFNVTWTDNYAMQDVMIEHNFTGTLTNYSTTGNNSNDYYYDYNDLTVGRYIWRMIANDTEGNYNATAQYTYTVQQGTTTTQLYLNGSQANLSTVYDGGFNATGVTDSLNVSIYRNGTLVNESTDLIAFYYAQLAVGHYNITAKNPGNGYAGSQETWWLTITKAASSVNFLINGTDANYSIDEDYTLNLTGLLVAGQGDLTLYENGTQIDTGATPLETLRTFNEPGMYNLTLKYNSTENYTSSFETHWIQVNDTTAPNWTNNIVNVSSGSAFSEKGYQFNVSWTDNVGVEAVWIEHNFTGTVQNITITTNIDADGITYYYNYGTIGTGKYYWRQYANDSIGNLNQTAMFEYVVVKGAGEVDLALDGSDSNITVGAGAYVNMTARIVTPAEGQIEMYDNGTLINNGTSPISNLTLFPSVSHHNITAVYRTTENFTSHYETHWITVSPDITKPEVRDASADPSTINQGQTTNITANVTDNLGFGNVYAEVIFSNGTAVNYSMENAVGDIWNYTFYATPNHPEGLYYVTIIAMDSANNVNATETTTFTVNDITRPRVTDIEPNAQWYNLSTTININATVIDETNVSIVLANITWDSTSQIIVMEDNDGDDEYNATFTSTTLVGRYNITIIANDTSNNVNNTETAYFYINDTIKPAINLNSPIDHYNASSDSIIFNFTATDDYYSTLNCTLYIDGDSNGTNAATPSGTATVFAINNMPEGVHSWNITCYDASLNQNNSGTRQFRVDYTAPSVVIASPEEQETYYTTSIDLKYNAVDTGIGIDTCWYSLNAGANTVLASCANTSITAIEGTNSLALYANDSLNNVNSASVTFNVDVSAPAILVQSPRNLTLYNTRYLDFNISVIDASNISWVGYAINGNANTTITANTLNITAETNTANAGASTQAYKNVSQSVMPEEDMDVFFLSVKLLRTGQPNGTFYLVNDDGSNHPDMDSILGYANVSTLSMSQTSFGWVNISFNETVSLAKDTRYWLVLGDVWDGSNDIEWEYTTTDVYSRGQWLDFSGLDLMFRLHDRYKYRTNISIPDGFNNDLHIYANDSGGNMVVYTVENIQVDATPPALKDAFEASDPIEAGSTQVLKINATEATTSIDKLYLEFNLTTNYTMTKEGSTNRYNRSIYIGNIGTYYYRFIASDIAGNWNLTALYDFTSQDTTDPSIENISYYPNTTSGLDPGRAVNITADVLDVLIDAVLIQYRMTNQTVWLNASMSNVGGSTFNGEFTPTEGNWTFRLWANDTSGNTNISYETNLTVYSEETWTRDPADLGTINANSNQKVALGNITITNEAEEPYSYALTTVNPLRTWVYFSNSSFTIAGGDSKIIRVNATAPVVEADYSITIFINETTGNSSVTDLNTTAVLRVSQVFEPVLEV